MDTEHLSAGIPHDVSQRRGSIAAVRQCSAGGWRAYVWQHLTYFILRANTFTQVSSMMCCLMCAKQHRQVLHTPSATGPTMQSLSCVACVTCVSWLACMEIISLTQAHCSDRSKHPQVVFFQLLWYVQGVFDFCKCMSLMHASRPAQSSSTHFTQTFRKLGSPTGPRTEPTLSAAVAVSTAFVSKAGQQTWSQHGVAGHSQML